jgi:hypothetical protein
MWKRIIGFSAAAFLLSAVPSARTQQAPNPPIFTFVSQFQVPRANWTQAAEDAEKFTKPVFDRLMADGTIIGWGTYENTVHTPDGMTHGSWWASTSLAGIQKVLDEFRKAGPRPWQLASTKHRDFLLRSVFGRGSPVAGSSGYLRVIGVVTQPGKTEQYVDAIKKYLVPSFDELLKNGSLTSYGMSEQFVNTEAPSLRFLAYVYPNAAAMDTAAAAVAATLDKMSADDRKAWQGALAESTVPNSRRDEMYRITHYAHK